MKSPEDNNQSIENGDVNPQKENVQKNIAENVHLGRREFLGFLGKSAIAGAALTLGISSTEARADDGVDDYLNKLYPPSASVEAKAQPKAPSLSVIKSDLSPKDRDSEKLTTVKEAGEKAEVPIMNEAMMTIQKYYLKPSFIVNSVPLGKTDDVKNDMRTAMKFYKELRYEKTGDTTTISRRKSSNVTNIPQNFKIVIKNGVITQVGNAQINQKALEKGRREWERLEKQTDYLNRRLLKGKSITNNQWKVVEYYTIKLPRHFVEILEAKKAGFGLNADEESTLKAMKKVLGKHPRNIEEATITFTRLFQFYGGRRLNAKPNTIEFTNSTTFMPIAAFDFDGKVLKNKDPNNNITPKWVDGSDSFEKRHQMSP